MNIETKRDVETLWNYLCLRNEPIKADCIIGLGSILKNVPKKCAELYQKGLGDYIIFTGNCGKGTEGIISKTEAEIFKSIAIAEGVPEDKILIETKATNTYENIKYSLEVLKENGLFPESFLIVGKPYQERRAECIASVELTRYKFSIAPFLITFDEFLEYVETNNLMSLDDVINELVGEINICILAPNYEIQQKCDIPDEVMESYERLCKKGYTRYLVTDSIIQKTIEKWKCEKLIR